MESFLRFLEKWDNSPLASVLLNFSQVPPVWGSSRIFRSFFGGARIEESSVAEALFAELGYWSSYSLIFQNWSNFNSPLFLIIILL